MNTSDVIVTGRRRRRRHSQEFKTAVIEACRQPGVSIAAIALANGLNANLLRKWVIDAEGSTVAAEVKPTGVVANAGAQFIALATPASCRSEIGIEVQRGAMTIKVSWPSEVASECGAWLRELLR